MRAGLSASRLTFCGPEVGRSKATPHRYTPERDLRQRSGRARCGTIVGGEGAATGRGAPLSITARAGRSALGELAVVGAVSGGGIAVGREHLAVANQKGARHLANVAPRSPDRVP